VRRLSFLALHSLGRCLDMSVRKKRIKRVGHLHFFSPRVLSDEGQNTRVSAFFFLLRLRLSLPCFELQSIFHLGDLAGCLKKAFLGSNVGPSLPSETLPSEFSLNRLIPFFLGFRGQSSFFALQFRRWRGPYKWRRGFRLSPPSLGLPPPQYFL